jgi:hypothetical protein
VERVRTEVPGGVAPRSRHLNLTFPGLRPEAFKCRRKRGNSIAALAGDCV